MSDLMMRVRAWVRRPAVLLLLALVALACLISLAGRLFSPPPDTRTVALTSDPGAETFPAFSPDGRRVAYSARATGAAGGHHILVKSLRGTAVRITTGDGDDTSPAWSPDGNLLALARLGAADVSYVVIPAAGGAEREIGRLGSPGEDVAPARLVAWWPDGKALVVAARMDAAPAAIYRLPLDGGPPRRLTNPPAASEGDFNPAVSPDGAWLAFTRRATAESEDLYVMAPGGGDARRLTFDEHPLRGLAWAGGEIVFASSRVGDWRLYRTSPGASGVREIAAAGQDSEFPAAGGGRLAWCRAPQVSNIWRAPLPEGAAMPIIASAHREFAPRYSADGRRIAFVSERGGSGQIWTAGAGGEDPVQVTRLPPGTHVMRPAWAPDGRAIVFDVRMEMRPEVLVAAVEPGRAQPPRTLAGGPAVSPSWSRDGRSIYFTRGHGQIFRAAPDGRSAQPMAGSGSGALESVDGKHLFYYNRGGIWRLPVAGGEGETQVVEGRRDLLGPALAATPTALYFLRREPASREVALWVYEFRADSSHRVRPLPGFSRDRAPAFDVSPDGKYVVYPRTNQGESDLMLLERFR